jgi:membrane protein
VEPAARVGRRRDFALRLAKRSLVEFLDDGCPQLAASIAYHVLFSIFPLAIVAGGISGIVLDATGSQASTVDSVVRHLPLSPSGRDQVSELLLGATGHLSAVGLVGVTGLVYSASGMMSAIRTALNQAWDADRKRRFLRGKLVDVGLVALMAPVVLASLGLTILLHVIAGGGWLVFSFAAPLLVVFAIVLFLYRVVPTVEVRVADAWPAALLVAALFTALENGFAVYVSRFGHYNAIYGSLGGVIAFMFFVYLSSQLFLLGAEVASEWPRVQAELAEDSPQRSSDRGRVTTTEGESDADPHGQGGDGDRGDPRGLERGAGGRTADQRRDAAERERVAGVRARDGADRR